MRTMGIMEMQEGLYPFLHDRDSYENVEIKMNRMEDGRIVMEDGWKGPSEMYITY